MSASTDNTVIHTPEGMAYTCHNAGVCCHVFDTIPLDAKSKAAMAELDVAELNHLAGNEPDADVTVADAAGPPVLKMNRKTCGDCTMLTPDKLCAVHAHAGEAAKPRVCQDFPFRYVETPGGVYVGLSFVCPSVRGNKGQLLSEQSEKLQVHYTQAMSVRTTPERISLNARISLSWEDYLEVESVLMELLAMENEPLSVRLIACCMVPGFIDQMLTQASAPAEETWAPDAEKGAGGVPRQVIWTPAPGFVPKVISAIRANGYAPILRIARKQTPPNYRSRRMFLGMFTGFANTLHQRDKGRLATVLGVMGQYIRHALGLGTVRLQPFEKKLSHEQLDQAVVPVSGFAADQITRYITHCVFRKDLALTGDVTRRVRLLALNAALIPWYAYAVAADTGSGGSTGFSVPRDPDWDEAIGQVERLYGFHSAFYRFFEQNRAFSDIVDSFILKPTYPFTLFRK